jgi:hypothetical protein
MWMGRRTGMNTWDDELGFDLCDPHHPTWLERMEAAAESKRDVEKENGSGDVPRTGDCGTGDGRL